MIDNTYEGFQEDKESHTVSFRLGKAILKANSFNGLKKLPFELFYLRKEVINKRKREEIKIKIRKIDDLSLSDVYGKFGVDGVLIAIRYYFDSLSNYEKAMMLLKFGKEVEKNFTEKNTRLQMAIMAMEYSTDIVVLRNVGWAATSVKDINVLKSVLIKLEEIRKITNDSSELKKIESAIELFKEKEIKIKNEITQGLNDIKVKNKIEDIFLKPGYFFDSAKGILNIYNDFNKKDLVKLTRKNIQFKIKKIMMNEPLFERCVIKLYMKGGSQNVILSINKYLTELSNKDKALLLLKAGKVLRGISELAEIELAKEAIKIDDSQSTLRGALWAFQRAKDFKATAELISKLNIILGKSNNIKDVEFLEKIKKTPAFTLTITNELDCSPLKNYIGIKNKIVYVLHNSFPYSSGGYATRGYGLTIGLKAQGYNVVIINRPGFPLDIKEELTNADVPLEEFIDDVLYIRLLSPLRKGLTSYEYIIKAADVLEKQFKKEKPEIVIAASNHITALPALIAAKRLGIPFIYEVRGFWEITRVSREPSFEDTASFAVQKRLEAVVAQHAHKVFTLTGPMIDELVKRGVKREKISLLPNSCDPTKFLPCERSIELAKRLNIPKSIPVIGYIGTFVQYEGLDDLAEACAILKQKGVKFRLLLVGNENASGSDRGPITEKIYEIARNNDFENWLIMPGRVPHEEVEEYYSLIDIAPFPRKPQPVCEMVSPMKPLEASAMKKAIIVSSVKALTEMIIDGETGLVFEKGNTIDLAEKLNTLLKNKPLRVRLGENGRKWVESERTWNATAEKANLVIKGIVG